jgi:L-threonylcarbamoyladenylate synthase
MRRISRPCAKILAKRPPKSESDSASNQIVNTIVATTESNEASDAAIQLALQHLRNGDAIGLPTETVYGLAADASNEAAVAKIFEAKERPKFDPLIVHLPNTGAFKEVADVPEELEEIVSVLTTQFWPGPLTLLLPKRPVISDLVTSGLDTVGVRMSEHPVFRQIARQFGRPLAAPSANRFGRISPTSAAAVVEELSGRIPLVVDGGACGRGLESTIVRVFSPTGKSPKPGLEIVRAGPVTIDELKKYCKILKKKPGAASAVGENKVEAPGQLGSHYAPGTPLRVLVDPDEFKPEERKRYGLLSFRGEPKDGYIDLMEWDEVAVLSPGAGKMPEAAIRFFFLLRSLDRAGLDEIIAEPIPERGLGIAMMDRLCRASVGS